MKVLLWLVVSTSLILLLAILSLGIYIRPASDDYLFMLDNGTREIGGLIHYTLFFINGRISSLITYIVGYSIPGFINIAPAVGTIIITIGLYMLSRSFIADLFKAKTNRLALLALSLTIVSATYLTLPSIYASLFWFAAAPVHVWGYGFFFIYFSILISGFLLKSKSFGKNKFFLAYSLLPFATGLFNEVIAILLISTTALALIVAIYNNNPDNKRIALWGLISSLISLAVLYFAPGSINRRERISAIDSSPMHERLMEIPPKILEDLGTTLPIITNNPSLFFLVFGLATIIGFSSVKSRIPIKRLSLIIAILIGSVCASYLINIGLLLVTGAASIPPLRVYFMPFLFLNLAIAYLGVYFGLVIKRFSVFRQGLALGAIMVFVLFSINPIDYGKYLIDLRSTMKHHASQSDARDLQIRGSLAEGDCIIKSRALPQSGIDDLQSDRNQDINRIIYGYYAHANIYDQLNDSSCGVVPSAN